MATKPKPKAKEPPPNPAHAQKQVDKSNYHFKRLIKKIKKDGGYER